MDSSEEFFEWYYRRQLLGKVIQDENDFKLFLRELHKPLPVTFRFNHAVGDQCERDILENETEQDPSMKHLKWCDAWQVEEGDVFEMSHARPGSYLHSTRKWLSAGVRKGIIVRQEAVSMLPVKALGIREGGKKILDMCASPGSKTIQLVDSQLQHGNTSSSKSRKRKRNDLALVVGNELDARRAHILEHRLRELGKDAREIFKVVTHKAQTFPKQQEGEEFDMVVCDVPCSGDGTLRKNKAIWNHWVPHYGLQLHSTQVQIAMRGLSLLKVGGNLVYSTCSFNPLENEAVVASILERTQGRVRLLNTHARLGSVGFKTRPGLKTWDVIDDMMSVYSNFEHSQKHSRPRKYRHRFRRSMFPTSYPKTTLDELVKCVRVLPHDNNCGGFFIAVFHKIKEMEK